MAIEEILKRIIFIIRDYLSQDYQILLFGSWAKGNALNISDIDIGILGENVAPRSIMTQILEKIENIPTLRSIDIVDLKTKEENYRNNILKYAKILD